MTQQHQTELHPLCGSFDIFEEATVVDTEIKRLDDEAFRMAMAALDDDCFCPLCRTTALPTGLLWSPSGTAYLSVGCDCHRVDGSPGQHWHEVETKWRDEVREKFFTQDSEVLR